MSDKDRYQLRPSGDKIDAEIGDNGKFIVVGKNVVQIGSIKIPIWLAVIMGLCLMGLFLINIYPSVKPYLPKYWHEFASASPDETLIVIATFHVTTATNVEPHIKIQRAIAAAAAKYGEQKLRVEVESTELNADQREQAEKLGRFYNAAGVIWGEDTGVQSIINFLNLRKTNYDTHRVTIEENKRIQLSADPAPYAKFITHDLPQEMAFFALFVIGQSHYMKGLYESQQNHDDVADSEYIKAVAILETGISELAKEVPSVVLADAYFRLGWVYQQSSVNTDDAIQNYTKAIEYNPELVGAYMNRGNAYYDLNDFLPAIADYTKAIELKPDLVRAYINRGNTYYYTQKINQSIDDFKQAIKLDPKDADAKNNLRISLDTLQRLNDGLVQDNQIIANNPNDVTTYLDRALIHYSLDEMAEALLDYTKAIKLNPRDPKAYLSRGIVFNVMDRPNDAIADFSKSIELDPAYARTFAERGASYRKLGKLQEALLDFRHYLELWPDAVNSSMIEQWTVEIEAELAK